MTTAIWAGRLEGQADDLFREFNDSLPFDRQLVREDVEGSIAWSKALVRAGVLTAQEQREIEAALGEILAAWREDPSVLEQAEDEDVHSWVERQLVLRVGDLGRSCTPAAAETTRWRPTCGSGRLGSCGCGRPR